MTQSESIAQLAAALAKAQAALEPAIKDADNPFFKSKYADLGEVWRVVQEAYTPHGLSIVQVPETRENGAVALTTVILHESGEWLAGTMPVLMDKETPQGVGSGITYARRYALAAMCGVVAEPDDDGEAAMGRNGAKYAPQAPPTPPVPQVPTIGQAGVKTLGTITAQVATALGTEKEQEWAKVMAEIGRRYGLKLAGAMTEEQAEEIMEWLSAKVPKPEDSEDIFDGGVDATRLPKSPGGE